MSQFSRRQFNLALAATIAGLSSAVHTSNSAEAADNPDELSRDGRSERSWPIAMLRVSNMTREPKSARSSTSTPKSPNMRPAIEKSKGMRPKIYSDFRDALESDDIQIVTSATPNHWHALMGVWAMQAGKDVYIEKPISHNIHEGRALVAAAKKYGRMFQTGTQCRSSTACQDAVKFIADGGIGEVKFARGLCYKRRKSIGPLGDYPIPEKVDFDLWSGPATYTDPKLTRQRFHYDWHWQRHYGNGDLGKPRPHQTDIARWGLGSIDIPSRSSATADAGYQAERKDPRLRRCRRHRNTEVSIYDYGDNASSLKLAGWTSTIRRPRN